MMKQKEISSEEISILRQLGKISSEEIAFTSGDLLIAENVITGHRRILGDSKILDESSKRLLKG